MMDAINRLLRLLLLATALSTAAALSQHPSNALELPCPRFPRQAVHGRQPAERQGSRLAAPPIAAAAADRRCRSRLPPGCRPHYEQKAEMARWLAHQLDWGVVSTTSRSGGRPQRTWQRAALHGCVHKQMGRCLLEGASLRLPPPSGPLLAHRQLVLAAHNPPQPCHLSPRHLGGVAFGNALSFADGPRCRPTGRLIFYLSPMDATMQDLEKCSNASLTLHEAQLPGACKGVDPESPLCAKLTVTGGAQLGPQLAGAPGAHLLTGCGQGPALLALCLLPGRELLAAVGCVPPARSGAAGRRALQAAGCTAMPLPGQAGANQAGGRSTWSAGVHSCRRSAAHPAPPCPPCRRPAARASRCAGGACAQ